MRPPDLRADDDAELDDHHDDRDRDRPAAGCLGNRSAQ
jgi:hypothetical protein